MRLFLIAGESSGDRLGADLMAGLAVLSPGIAFEGIGGPLMEARGLTSLFPMEELSVMGLAEILPRLAALRRRIRQAAEAVLASDAAALVTIDSPDFCLRVARLVRRVRPGLRVIHYVAPSVWAWRPGRARRMARVVDHVLALLPFEPPYMTAAGMSCDFVGHPVAAEPVVDAAGAASFRARYAIGADAPLLAVLPGSRQGELARHLGPFGESVHRLAREIPDLRLLVVTPAHLESEMRARLKGWPGDPVLLVAPDSALRCAGFAAADAALAASGTVSLELAAQGCPMVIAYDLSRVTLWLARRLVRVDTVTLVNLVAESRTVPEFIGRDCAPEKLVPALRGLLGNGPGDQAGAMQLTMERLGRGGEAPGLRAARSVLAAIGAGPGPAPPERSGSC